jgi:hypothetical protein
MLTQREVALIKEELELTWQKRFPGCWYLHLFKKEKTMLPDI